MRVLACRGCGLKDGWAAGFCIGSSSQYVGLLLFFPLLLSLSFVYGIASCRSHSRPCLFFLSLRFFFQRTLRDNVGSSYCFHFDAFLVHDSTPLVYFPLWCRCFWWLVCNALCSCCTLALVYISHHSTRRAWVAIIVCFIFTTMNGSSLFFHDGLS